MTIKEIVSEYLESNSIDGINSTEVARRIRKQYDIDEDVSTNAIRLIVSRTRPKDSTTTETAQYNDKPQKYFNAIGEDGRMMDINTYCIHYNLPRKDIKSYKLVTHTAIPYYNIAFFESEEIEDLEDVKEEIKKFTSKFKVYKNTNKGQDIAVVKISDIHFGAFVSNLIKTKDYSTNHIAELFQKIANEVNKYNYKEVHIHILGDLIESFTGLNHKNSWKNIEYSMIGADVIKMCVSFLHLNLLSRINNLKDIKVIGGNHDRLTSGKDEDQEAGAANLISWGLELIGYDVEFNPNIISHEVDNINHILLHGHNLISKKTTQQICWDYGKQGLFNLVTEGHLHSYIEKNSSKINFNSIKDDGIDHLRMVCRSLFTGNRFSEYLGYYSLSGFHIVTNNGNDKPNINNIIL